MLRNPSVFGNIFVICSLVYIHDIHAAPRPGQLLSSFGGGGAAPGQILYIKNCVFGGDTRSFKDAGIYDVFAASRTNIVQNTAI